MFKISLKDAYFIVNKKGILIMKIGFLSSQNFGKVTQHAWQTYTSTENATPDDYNFLREQAKNQKYHVHYNNVTEKYEVCTMKEEKDIRVNEDGDTVSIKRFMPVLKDSKLLSDKDIHKVGEMATAYENAHYYPSLDSGELLI